MAKVQRVTKTNTPTCKLDENDCLSLLHILKAFDGPINEERTWAVLHQAAKCANSCFLSSTSTTASTDSTTFKCCVASEPAHILIHRDGSVHPKSFTVDITSDLSEGRTVATSQSKLVSALGWAVFEALDYGCTRDEHHALSPDLEQIIDLMTASGEECNSAEDEGIERDSSEMEEPSSAMHPNALTSLTQVLDRCQMQISSTASSVQADTHFRAVCRALVAETLEFSDFLAKVTSGPEEWRELRSKPELQCPELTELHLADWARLWVQVIRQLRNGVKLKSKSESARKPIEYELTPYEMMMDDIRSRRYKLRTVMVDGQIPQRVKKDAHAVILEFIRSRPPLRKASERTLRPPARKVSTPVELLMESIRQHDHRGLRPTKSLMVDKTDMSSSISSLTSKRKLLKADFDQLLPNSANDDDDDLADVPASSPPHESYASSGSYGLFESCTSSEVSTPLSRPDAGCKARNLTGSNLLFPSSAFQGCGSREPSPNRRHSSPNAVTRTMSAPFPKSQSHHAQLQRSYAQQPHKDVRRRIPVHLQGGDSLPNSGPASSASSTSSVSIPSPPGSPCMLPVLDPLVEHARLANIQDEFLQSKNFESVDCLALTLEEMVHIRRVLTKADLEDLPLDASVKDEIANGKVCFVCLKTRFAFFGPSGHRCKLCMQVVCAKCCSKMRIPTEHFANVPVFTLAPTRCSQQHSSQQAQSHASASLFSNFHLRIPQFRIHAPVDGQKDEPANTSTPVTGGSTPSSPWFSRRRKNATVAAGSCSRPNNLSILTCSWAQHSQEQRRESLSAESTPRKSRISRSESVRNKTSTASSSEHPVCRDCQTLIEQIVLTADTLAVVADTVHSSVPVSLP